MTWSDPDNSFDVTDVSLAPGTKLMTLPGVRLAPTASTLLIVSTPTAATRLRVIKRRTARSLDVRIKGVRRGKLTFKIVAKRLDGRARVRAKIRQSKR